MKQRIEFRDESRIDVEIRRVGFEWIEVITASRVDSIGVGDSRVGAALRRQNPAAGRNFARAIGRGCDIRPEAVEVRPRRRGIVRRRKRWQCVRWKSCLAASGSAVCTRPFAELFLDELVAAERQVQVLLHHAFVVLHLCDDAAVRVEIVDVGTGELAVVAAHANDDCRRSRSETPCDTADSGPRSTATNRSRAVRASTESSSGNSRRARAGRPPTRSAMATGTTPPEVVPGSRCR